MYPPQPWAVPRNVPSGALSIGGRESSSRQIALIVLAAKVRKAVVRKRPDSRIIAATRRLPERPSVTSSCAVFLPDAATNAATARCCAGRSPLAAAINAAAACTPGSLWYGATLPAKPFGAYQASAVSARAAARDAQMSASASNAGSLRASAIRSSPTAAPAQPSLIDAVGGGEPPLKTSPPAPNDPR